MKTEGLDLGEMQIKLLQKIEELTLYVINLSLDVSGIVASYALPVFLPIVSTALIS